MEKAGEAAAKPTAEEAWQLREPGALHRSAASTAQEIAIEATPEQVAQLRAKMASVKNVGESVDYQGQRLPLRRQPGGARRGEGLASVGMVSAMQDGQVVLNATPNGALVAALACLAADRAGQGHAAISNSSKRAQARTGGQRFGGAEAGARIEYVGKFAEGAAAGSACARRA